MGAMTDRRPRWVYDAGSDPDPRYTLANERTFLAWVRTSIGLLAGGVALHALGLPDSDWLRTTLAVLLVLFGAATCAFALVRWARVERAMRTHQPLPAFSLGFVMTGAVVVGAVLLAVAFL
jgi:putative membrane protein